MIHSYASQYAGKARGDSIQKSSRTALTFIQKHFRGIYDLQGERAELCVAEIVLIELIF